MKKKWEKREKPLTTFDQLLKDYGIEIVDSSESKFPPDVIPLIVDDTDIITHIDLSHLLEDVVNEETE